MRADIFQKLCRQCSNSTWSGCENLSSMGLRVRGCEHWDGQGSHFWLFLVWVVRAFRSGCDPDGIKWKMPSGFANPVVARVPSLHRNGYLEAQDMFWSKLNDFTNIFHTANASGDVHTEQKGQGSSIWALGKQGSRV